MKIAIVHDFLNQYGGAERCLEVFHELFPKAPIYTLIHKPQYFRDADVRTSFAQKLPFAKKNHYAYLTLYPLATETLDLSGFDVILSSSASFSKNINKTKDSCHICYCHTIMRFVYTMPETYLNKINPLLRPFARLTLAGLKKWDLKQTKKVDYFIANSKNTQRKIKEHYQRDSFVIYPPVDTDFFKPKGKTNDFYLIVSRLQLQKRIDVAVSAFNHLGKKLKIIGTGPEFDRLKKMANPNIEFLGKLSDEEVRDYYQRCTALVFPGEEDLGITPLEAQACGKPVVAYAKGGLLETVVEGKTGHFFNAQTPESLVKAVLEFERMKFSSADCRRNALLFDRKLFKNKIRNFIKEKYRAFKHG